MKFPGMILMGAQSRLLPPSVPFRFFVAAALFHVVAWALLAADAGQIPQFLGGPGPVLAGLHALTLGVLVMTAIGASFQILPVVTGQSLRALWPCRLTFWLYALGVSVLTFGFTDGDTAVMAVGGGLATAGLALFAMLIADVLARTRGMRALVLHGWAALAALVVVAGLGLALVFDFDHGFLADRNAVAIAHVAVAVYGFMGMLVLGYSQFMIPMFALGPAPDERRVAAAFVLAVVGVGLAAATAWVGPVAGLLPAAALVGLTAAGLHIHTMRSILAQGMRKQLGLSFVLVNAAWGLLAVSLVLAAIGGAGVATDRIASLFGLAAVFGWLLTFLMGILQRIVPFLAAMNAAKAGAKPPTLSDVSVEGPLKLHAIGHFGALALIAAGIVADQAMAATAGALLGGLGALAFLWFVGATLVRMRRYGTVAETAGEAPSRPADPSQSNPRS